ncbi:MAG: PEP-CTERM sorting domain-containing protein [Planctomycetota bacterium]|jgi:hypothetical protein
MNRQQMICVCLLLGLCTPLLNAAYIYDFQIFNDINYQNNPNLDFTVEVWDLDGQAVFEFKNNSIMDSVITEIYFDDYTLLELDHIQNYVIDADNRIGTMFGNDRLSPKNLPGANLLAPDFQANRLLSVQPSSPPPKWGIGPDEKLRLFFNLTNGHYFTDLISAINSEQDLRIGMHIQCLGLNDDSASAVNIPEPSTLLLFGLGAVILRKRR